MPLRPAKACRKSGCPNPVTTNKHYGYCEQHKDLGGWFGNEKQKGNRHQRGYGSSWDNLRKLILKRDAHLCQACKKQGKFTRATHVDHIIPKSKGGTDSMRNLQSLCEYHHNQKTARE